MFIYFQRGWNEVDPLIYKLLDSVLTVRIYIYIDSGEVVRCVFIHICVCECAGTR